MTLVPQKPVCTMGTGQVLVSIPRIQAAGPFRGESLGRRSPARTVTQLGMLLVSILRLVTLRSS